MPKECETCTTDNCTICPHLSRAERDNDQWWLAKMWEAIDADIRLQRGAEEAAQDHYSLGRR